MALVCLVFMTRAWLRQCLRMMYLDRIGSDECAEQLVYDRSSGACYGDRS